MGQTSRKAKKFIYVSNPALYGTPSFITLLKTALRFVPILSKINPIHTLTCYFLNICLNFILPSNPSFSKLLSFFRFLIKIICALLSSLSRVTCLANHNLVDLINLIILVGVQHTLIFSLCNSVRFYITCCLLRSHTFWNIVLSLSHNLYSALNIR